ncbi:hypothetical protein DMN91_001184 [Ooceraea biroi]|uniref:Uncharacterized protein n=1 Tax=Ooceraea biroi TaxID=2015173 RepID=A0A3L8E3R0_OOCBI|nr:hypothetical protein DMN91_001184 [Ooceraea biroi]
MARLSSSDDAHAKRRTIDEERHVSRGSQFSVNTEETRRSSVASSPFASISDNANVHLGRRYDQINDETSAASIATATPKSIKEKKQLFLIKTSLHPTHKRNACDENVETG